MKKKNYSFGVRAVGKFGLILLALIGSTSLSMAQDLSAGLKLHYTFETANGSTVSDVSGNGYNGTLYGATVGQSNGKNSLILSTSGTDYLDMGANTGSLISSLTDFSMSCYVWVNSTYGSLGNNGNMIATFANSTDSYANSDGYMFLQAKRSRYAITTKRYETEEYVQTGSDMAKGKWVHFTYTQAGTTGKLYIDGALKSTNTTLSLTPSSLGATTCNFLAKPSYAGDKYLQDAQISDFRIYDREITSDEVMMLNGYSAELISAYNTLTLPNLTAVVSDLNLPTMSGNIPITWKSSLPASIDSTGKVTRPDKYDVTVKLTATFTQTVNGTTYTLNKEFTAMVKAFNVAEDKLAEWNFDGSLITEENGTYKVKDASASGFVGTVMNEARIRTIGSTDKYNVLDLGNGTGYFDMGTEIGQAIYSLNNYTMCGYFRIDDTYAGLNNPGNFFWTFSNSDNVPADKNGYIFSSLKDQGVSVSSSYWGQGNAGIGVGANAPKGGWHHFAYAQNGTTGTIYIDGVEAKKGTVDNIPSVILPQPGRTGTLYNWLGRSNYPGDDYLRQTLIYDFQLLSIPLSGDDLNFGLEVPATIDMLNSAYDENPDYILPELTTEMESLSLGDISAVSSNLTLPKKGLIDNTINITWKSSNSSIIGTDGTVTRPDYFATNVTLTASFTKNGQKVTKTFAATVTPKPETEFTSDLLVKYDFANVSNDTIVTDAAEKHFTGIIKNEAKIRGIGTTESGIYKVLELGDSIGYFDMGLEVGKLMYHQNDYTVGAYFRIDENYPDIDKNGNFLWNFSNSNDIFGDASGYIIGSLKNQACTISSNNWNGEQTVTVQSPALLGSWHHFAYTQNGTTGTVYVDGMPLATSADISKLPSTTLPKEGRSGTLYNWIGRSCYTPDVYLRNTLVYDFRIYRKALNDEEVQSTVLDVANTIGLLDAAYLANPNNTSGLKTTTATKYRISSSNGTVRIAGLTGIEKVSVFDIAGRQMKIVNPSAIALSKGVYIVKIDGLTTKIMNK